MRWLLSLLPGLRAPTTVGWIAGLVVLVSMILIVLGGLGFRWDPFDLSRRRADRAEQTAAVARTEAASRGAESQGQAGQVARLDATLETLRSLDRATHFSIQTARTADDASLPLPIDRADRLREHDRRLCRSAPDLLGCTAAPDAPVDSDPPV